MLHAATSVQGGGAIGGTAPLDGDEASLDGGATGTGDRRGRPRRGDRAARRL